MPPINPKSLTMPLAAFTMAFVLLAYTRTSISAARSSARLQREVDERSWRGDARRRGEDIEREEGGKGKG
ncbi:hypothetical protein L873DRAFT_1798026 [Choiromyces venosus 120613-1]|uniref:Uncharacterized protein n=1 Tax=Choiromyces venosus 120613-1 TaxID=1336337 RepID=A0A3N4K3C3_9PEZI|nr:hypothetical protein L873DRAFT_1798026 [Choiromyces venosus 120613-1]